MGENPGNHPTPVRKEASTEETWTIRDSFMIAGRRCWVGRLGKARVWAGVAADGCRRPLLRHRSRRERDFRASGRAAGCPGVVPRAAVVRWTKRLHARTHRTRAVMAPFGRLRPLPHSLVNSTLPLWIHVAVGSSALITLRGGQLRRRGCDPSVSLERPIGAIPSRCPPTRSNYCVS